MSIQTNSFAKRVKRQVIGRSRSFFAATPPGLENVCLKELASPPLSFTEVEEVPGGVEFRGRVHDAYMANLHLRTANRILMRIDGFKAANFRQLERRLADVPWEIYLPPGIPVHVRVATSKSRLYHKAAIAQRFQSGIALRLERRGVEGDSLPGATTAFSRQTLFIRVVEDRFTVSLDSSGEPLYKRGIKKDVGRAPLRETLAAAALKLAGFSGEEPLLDPMCGSGTFAMEGAMMAMNIPPGRHRKFAFMEWPAFRPRRWAHLRRQAEALITRVDAPMVFASDKDERVLAALEKNLRNQEIAHAIQVSGGDFFHLSPPKTFKTTGVIAINPPYGMRLGAKREIRGLYSSILAKLNAEFKGWKLALITPDRRLAGSFISRMAARTLSHGGVKILLLTGKV